MTSARPASNQTTLLLACLAALGLGGLPGCGEQCREIGGHRACGPRAAQVPIDGSDGAWWVPGRVNGQAVQLLVDTGAETTVVSSRLLSVVDQSPQVLHQLCVGDYCLNSEPIYAWETPFSTIAEGKAQGFVGMSSLGALGIRIAYGQQLTIGDGDGGIDDCAGESIALTLSDVGTPLVDAMLDGHDVGRIALDTGATRSLLDQSTGDALGSYLKDQSVLTSSCTVSGCSDNSAYLGHVHQICLADVCVDEVEVKFPAWNAVGANWLARHDVRFDFRQPAIIFCDL